MYIASPSSQSGHLVLLVVLEQIEKERWFVPAPTTPVTNPTESVPGRRCQHITTSGHRSSALRALTACSCRGDAGPTVVGGVHLQMHHGLARAISKHRGTLPAFDMPTMEPWPPTIDDYSIIILRFCGDGRAVIRGSCQTCQTSKHQCSINDNSARHWRPD